MQTLNTRNVNETNPNNFLSIRIRLCRIGIKIFGRQLFMQMIFSDLDSHT